jgi:hypothetical protein
VIIVTKMRFVPLPRWFLDLFMRFQYSRHVRSVRAFAIVARHERAAEVRACQAVMPRANGRANGTREKSTREARGLKADSCDFDHST